MSSRALYWKNEPAQHDLNYKRYFIIRVEIETNMTISRSKQLEKIFPRYWRETLYAEDVVNLLCLDRDLINQKSKALICCNRWDHKKLQELLNEKTNCLRKVGNCRATTHTY